MTKEQLSARLNLIMDEARFILASFEEITAYLARKGFIA